MSVLIAIPARYASSRYPGKPLVVLNGPDGAKTLIQRSWEAAQAVKGADRVVVATDDERIKTHAESFGAALKWEASRGGALFPHLYRPLRLADVVWDKSLPLGISGHIFPEGVI